MPLVLPRRSLNLDFVRDGQATGDNYPDELSKLDGLLTFSRSSTATRFNASGILETVAAGQPRFDFDPVTLACKGLLMEESRTNLAVQSQALATTWSAGGANVTNAYTTQLGLPFCRVQNLIGSNLAQVVALGSDGTKTLSVFVRADGVAGFYVCGVYDITATAWRGVFSITVDGGGAVSAAALGAGTVLAVQSLGSGVYRLVLQIPACVAANTNAVWLTASGNGETLASVQLSGVQLEGGAFATSYIPTTTTAVTRAAETCITSALSPWYTQGEGTLVFDVGAFAFAVNVVFSAGSFFTDINNRIDAVLYRYGSGASDILSNIYTVNAGAGVARDTSLAAPYDRAKFAVRFSRTANSLKGFVNAAEITAGGNAATTYPAAVAQLRLGEDGAGSYLNGHLRRLTYLPYAVSDGLLKALST